MRIVLASNSPRRQQLLAEAGYDLVIEPAWVEEQAPEHLTPVEMVVFNAKLKAETVAEEFPEEIVLGADTIVALGRQIFGKPRDMLHALETLRQLRGQPHSVWTGVWMVHRSSGARRGLAVQSEVLIRHLDDEAIMRYLEVAEPFDKAGSYAAQDDDGELIERIDGSFTNVVGLPMEKVQPALLEFAELVASRIAVASEVSS